ncbi:hypothetical protein Cme02nite_33570 [Catellatospora methionotrophica]|uniref:Peptidase inhibitor family I36 n=1 Tax=Catellatospora methionotrophica TaxID=121620 RepID=A0A8J3LIB9_9ACTN|nr:hypothetical protein [Catellatospora methionotrophica]GIG15025.1 hypothetical protein Cme02nite_33570 [Catellatospora methionotrophica]
MVRRLMIAAAVAALGFGIAPASPALAYGQCAANTKCGWLYYADAARTQLQGGHTTNCQGVVLDWGIKAGYSTYLVEGCDDRPPVE